MNRTNIEWTDYTWNPCTGCTRLCEYCYARKMAETRLRGRFGYPKDEPFRPTFHPNRLHEPSQVNKPSKIFVCSMGELFDPMVKPEWREKIFEEIRRNPQHTFQILTKRPFKMKGIVFPENAWVGTTITKNWMEPWLPAHQIADCMRFDVKAKTKFISFEPLLERIIMIDLKGIDWIIIGAQTNPDKQPNEWWVKYLTTRAKALKIPVFHKSNLENAWLKEFPNHLPTPKVKT